MSLTDCQRQQRLQSYIIYMLNTTDMRNATLNNLRSIIDTNKMKSLLRNSGNQVLHQRECTGQGFSAVQCEVSMDNLNSRQCYCADTRTGEILPGHTKSYTKPTDCSGGKCVACFLKQTVTLFEMYWVQFLTVRLLTDTLRKGYS